MVPVLAPWMSYNSGKTDTMTTIWFVSNFVFGNQISGGVVHYLEMAKACRQAGYDVRFIGGSGLKRMLTDHGLDVPLLPTDSRETAITEPTRLKDQVAVFRDNVRRCRNAFALLHVIRPDDLAYAVTDYWCDTLPVMQSKARHKLMILGMLAPSLADLLTCGRPDVQASKMAALHYHLSQSLSLHLFRRCHNKHLFYVHPEMLPPLLSMGYRKQELVFISNGVNTALARQIPEQDRRYDVAWAGRVHRQKGIDDLLFTLATLSSRIPSFKALIIGSAQRELAPLVKSANLEPYVTFSGFVPEMEKLRLLKSSRLFLMPSHYESWGIVIAEALACDTPVVAYDIPPYRPIFGDLPVYVPCFDKAAFAMAAERIITTSRQGSPPPLRYRHFADSNSWNSVGDIFVQVLNSLPSRLITSS